MAEEQQREIPTSTEVLTETIDQTSTLVDERLAAYRMWALDLFEQVSAGKLTQEKAADIIARVRYASDIELEQTRRETFRDPLTGLPNKGAFNERIEQLIKEGVSFSLLFIDLDDFKKINSMYGYSPADSILVQVGLTLSSKTKSRKRPHEEDLVARWGGEEFAILLFDVPGELELLSIAERHRMAIEDGFRVDGHGLDGQTKRRIPTTASIAGAIYRGGDIGEFFIRINHELRQIKEVPTDDGQIHKNRCVILDTSE